MYAPDTPEEGEPSTADDDGGAAKGLGAEGRRGPTLGDAARIEVAWPVPGDVYLRRWTKTAPGPVSFEGLPCSFPGRVWKSTNTMKGKPYWNQVCAFNGTLPWARYTTTDPRLMSWAPASGLAGTSHPCALLPEYRAVPCL